MLLLRVLFLCLLALILNVAARKEDWLHCTMLDSDGKFNVCWYIEISSYGESKIVFRVEVQALGYVGFGLSKSGGMTGSDIVTGWVKDGDIYFQDRHGTGNVLPVIDSKTDWELLHGKENSTHTSLTFRRKLDTCDSQDMRIDDSTMRVIYAYSDDDPTSENRLQYHQGNRGAKSVILKSHRKNQKKLDKSQLLHWDIISPNYTFTSDNVTVYWCSLHRSPSVEVKHHIVGAEHLIKTENKGYIHHMVLYRCVGINNDDLDSQEHSCNHLIPDAKKICNEITIIWGVGDEDFTFPENVGLPLEAGISQYYMLEIHYYNPFYHDGVTDNSGLRIFYTPRVRKYDAGTWMVGGTFDQRSFIPPGQKEYTVAGHTSPDCLGPAMPKDGVNILGIALHAHLLGRHLKARHFRNNRELQPLSDDKNFDVHNQQYRYFTEERKFLPDDQMTIECTYDSSEKNVTTFGGLSISEEMCVAYVLYYPRIERTMSFSFPKLDEINKVLSTHFPPQNILLQASLEHLLDFNWSTVNIKGVENDLRYGQHDSLCQVGYAVINSSISYPKNFQPYKEISSCSQSHSYGEINKGHKFTGYYHFYLLLILVLYIHFRTTL